MKFLILALCLPITAHAFRLSPMVVQFSPAGRSATQTLTLENPGNERVAVEIEVFHRKIDADGKEDRSAATNDFTVFPAQLTLEPNQKRNLRVTWTGDQAPASELAFRLVASQLPVNLQRPTNRADVKVNLKFVLQYVASLYVTPDGAKAHLEVTAAKMTKPGTAEVTLKNKGNAHRVLENARLKLIGEKGEFTVPEAAMQEVRAQNILAGDSRRFTFTVPKEFRAVRAELKFE
jgi:fimbrial chaperone protein